MGSQVYVFTVVDIRQVAEMQLSSNVETNTAYQTVVLMKHRQVRHSRIQHTVVSSVLTISGHCASN